MLAWIAAVSSGCGGGANACYDASYVTTQSGAEKGLLAGATTSYAGSALAQSFVVPTSVGTQVSLSSVTLKMQRVGTLSLGQTVTVSIRADGTAPSQPDGAAKGSSYSVEASTLSTSMSTVLFTFSTPACITTGATYWVRAAGNWADSATNYVKWAANNQSTGTYTSGNAMYETGTPGTWSTSLMGSLLDFYIGLDCTVPATACTP